MPGKHGDVLGAELGLLYHAGQHDIPKVSNDYVSAWSHIPYSVSSDTWRGVCLGVDPGQSLDSLCDKVNEMIWNTHLSLDAVGEALVWMANTYAATDGTCAAAFDAKKKALAAEDKRMGR